MPQYSRPAELPSRLRSLNEALHDLHEHAGLPSTRILSNAIRQNDLLPTTASHERVRSALSKATLPQWQLVRVLVVVLCPLADRSPDVEIARFKALWMSAMRESKGEPEPAMPVEQVFVASHVQEWGSSFPQGPTNFALSMTRALRDQLAEALSKAPRYALSDNDLDSVERGPGVYQLFHRDELVYVGKAESLASRLGQAARKISGRRNISLDEMSFTCLQVNEDLTAIAPEALLLKRYRDMGAASWNQNGFGNRDAGRMRDGMKLPVTHFDVQYPVDLNLHVLDLAGAVVEMGEALSRLKKTLPYMFRFSDELRTSRSLVKFPVSNPMDTTLSVLVNRLGQGWQATVLPGHVILYEEDREYASALRTYRDDQPQ